MYDLNDLALYDAVVRHEGLSASARELCLPKSTLSRRIRDLEAVVGQALLRREANRMVPTEAGRLFHAYCQQLLSLAEQGRRALDELKAEVSGELTLHFHEAYTRGWLFAQVEDFTARYPNVRMVLRTRFRCLDAADDDMLCLWLGPVGESRLRQEVLGRLTRGIYAHPDYFARRGAPRHPAELIDHDWVDLLGETEGSLVLSHPREGRCEVPLPPSRMRVDQQVLQGDAITRGHGVGLFPHWLAQLRERNHPGSLLPCLPEWQASPLQVSLLYPYGQLPRRVNAFIEHLRRAAPSAWRGEPVVAA